MSIYNDLMSEKIDIIAPALRKAKSSFQPVIKNKQGFGYKYADFAGCLEAIEQALDDNGLVFSQTVEHRRHGKSGCDSSAA